MEATNIEEVIRNITRIILTNPQKMIREEDIRNLCKDFEFNNIISKVYLDLKKVGFELITSKFLDQNYYILTSYGKDDNITPSQYGTLALILALSKEVDENIKINDLKEIFGNVWNSDIKFLIDNDYIREFENLGIIKVTPLGKALLKNIVQDLQLKNLLRIFE